MLFAIGAFIFMTVIPLGGAITELIKQSRKF